MVDPIAIRRLVEAATSLPGYTRDIGTRALSVEVGRVEMALSRRPNLLQANGFFHGGVITGLADHAAGGAITSALPEGRFVVTLSILVNFLAPANGDTLVARAKVTTAGKTIGVATVEVVTVGNGAEELCAIATATMRVVDMPVQIAARLASAPQDTK